MSPSSGAPAEPGQAAPREPGQPAPRTPDRHSSSTTLFAAFRSLASGRLRSATPPPSGAQVPVVVLAPRPPGAIPSEGGQLARALLGGPPQLDALVAQVAAGQPLPVRALAVKEIAAILRDYPVRNIGGLWGAASDLLLPEQPAEAAAVGYQLLRSCVALPELSAVERNVFFGDAYLRKDYATLDQRLDIVATLTRGGRSIEACEAFLAPFILGSLESCFRESLGAFSAARKGPQTAKQPEQPAPNKAVENMARLFQYTIDVCKFNSKLFGDDDLELLLKVAMTISQETTQRADIVNAIRLFDTIITYVHVPTNALKPCLEVLCAVHYQLTPLQEQTWHVLSNLFKSHVGQAAVSLLLHALLDGPPEGVRQYNAYRGAIQVLQTLLFEDGCDGLPKVSISLLIPALKQSIKDENKTQESFAIGLIAGILADEKMRNELLDVADWTALIDIIRTCAERDDSREAAEKAVSAREKPAVEKATSTTRSPSLASGPDRTASVTSAIGDVDNDMSSTSDMPLSVAPPTRLDSLRKNWDDEISKVLGGLHTLSKEMELFQKTTIMELFMLLPHRLSDTIAEDMINFYIEERYFHPSNEDWLEACRSLVSGILKDATRPRSLRILSVKILRETYDIVEGICTSDTVLQCAALLLNNIEAEDDVEVLNELVDFAVDVIDRASDTSFADIMSLLLRRLEQQKLAMQFPPASPHPSWISSPFNARAIDHRLGSPCNVIATAFVRLFTRSVVKSARKTRLLYEILRNIVVCDAYDSDARLTAIKLLFRLRAESNHGLIVSSSSEGESIAAVLCRTTKTAVSEKGEEVALADSGKLEDQGSWRDQRKVSSSSPHSSLNRHASRHAPFPGRAAKPVPPLWMYPGPKGLPEEPSPRASRVVFSHVAADEYPTSDDILDMEVTLWLELVISLLQKAPDWEIYSYVLVHLGPQLSNQALVRSCVAQLRMLRSVICEQIRNATFHEPPSYTHLKKADVAVCLFHILTVLISYHDYYEKSEEDDVVKTFLHGMGSWDRASKWCIHALTVCCQETPLSVSKSLDSIIQKMSQIITKPSTAIHILEFLTSLARMPELFKNFREEEFKMVFGVSFRYLQHVRDQRDRIAAAAASQGGHRSLRHSGASRDFASSPDRHTTPAVADDLPQYLYALAYHLITFWFISLKMEDRPKQIPWITKNLIYTDSSGNKVMEEQGQVIVDMMSNVAYSDRDETTRDSNFAKLDDGEVWSKTWIAGHSLITVETAARTGVSLITSRRPCGTRYLFTRPLLAAPPSHQIPLTFGIAPQDFHSSSDIGILPDDIFQTYYAPLNMEDPPIPLPNDPMMRRSIETFDRNAPVDGYRVGVIYIGEGQMGQKNEKDILMNDVGSAAYTSFLNDLGTLVRLKGALFNTGGLDKNDDMDGEFTYCWRDRVIELVFHVTTMMRNDPDIDMTYANKKRHIGNDFVNIIFNDSGLPYDFNTFPSAFNYVAIVIAPESRASFVDRRLDTDPDGKSRYYKVQVMSKPGFPDISPAVEPKILAGKHLAAYCRLLAINASVFSQVWAIRDGGESISSWRNRLREIKRLRERYGASELSLVGTPSTPVLSSPTGRDTASPQAFKRTSTTAFIGEGISRSSMAPPPSSHDTAT